VTIASKRPDSASRRATSGISKARHPDELDVVLGDAVAAQAVRGAVDELLDHDLVEAAGDDREPQALAVERSFVHAHVRQPSWASPA
jgi:hypothetical protein